MERFKKKCPYYKCHDLKKMDCSFCYCPWYSCGDESLGGKWIKGEDGPIWDCSKCTWIHQPRIVRILKDNTSKIFKETKLAWPLKLEKETEK